ncbi:MAG: DUF4249 family protein, partial [Bacteroidetes bacterium]|nr:DUF4249 family protein [Bacteroidota bacterium]
AIPPQEALFVFSRTFSALLGTKDSIDIKDQSVVDLVLIDHAVATIKYLGVVDTLFQLAPGLYGSVHLDQLLATDFTLDLYDPKTGEKVSAQTRFLPKVPLDTAFPVQRILSGLGDTLHTLQFQFTDVPGTENYYLATYTNINTLASSLGNIGGVFNFNQIQFNVFSDKNNGDGALITYQPDFAGNAGDTLAVSLSNISKSYYEYLAAYKRSGNLLTQLTGEPVNLPTNVSGGFGFFALTRPSVKWVILE